MPLALRVGTRQEPLFTQTPCELAWVGVCSTDELGHAERQLARVRRLAVQREVQLTAQGVSELDVYREARAVQGLSPPPAVAKSCHQRNPSPSRKSELEFAKPQPYRERHALRLRRQVQKMLRRSAASASPGAA